jgi:hypothetical protein
VLKHRRALTLVVASAAVALIHGCAEVGAPGPGHTRFNGPASNIEWSNQPSGFTTVTDYAFNDAIPAEQNETSLSDGWVVFWNSRGRVTKKTDDASAPGSPDSVAQFAWVTGDSGGIGPGALMHDVGTSGREFYIGLLWKPSDPWQGHSSGVNKILFIGSPSAGAMAFTMRQQEDSSYELWSTLQFPGVSNTHLSNGNGETGSQNLWGLASPPEVELGEWHKIEIYVKMSTSDTSQDGVLKWWMDGTQIGNYTTVNFQDQAFSELKLNPTWGGIAGVKTQNDYYWFDHVLISEPSAQAAWPQEPSGFTTLTDYAFNDAIPAEEDVTSLSDGWAVLWNGRGRVTKKNDDTSAPGSPDSVAQFAWVTGDSGGIGPGALLHDMGTNGREFYIGLWWKPSNPWQGHPSGVNQLLNITSDSGMMTFVMRQQEDSSFQLWSALQFPGVSNTHLSNGQGETGSQNLWGLAAPPEIELGAWHRIEIYVKMSTNSTTQDGVLKWWMDGTQIGNYTTVKFQNPQFVEFNLNPIWGGVDGVKLQNDKFWYDHIRISSP